MTTSNILTGLMPSFFAALNMVNNEKTDAIDAVYLNASLEGAVAGQTITYPVAPPKTTYAITSQALPLDINGDTAGTGTLSISEVTGAAFKYTGEEQRQLALGGVSMYYRDEMAQCIRAIRNAVESKIVTTAALAACRATATPATTPFAILSQQTTIEMAGFGDTIKAMEDNGTGMSDIHMILSTAAASNLRKAPNLYKVNEAGTDRMLRTGDIGQIQGFNVGVSPQIKTKHVMGACTGGTLNGVAAAGPFTTPQTINVTGATGAISAGDLFVMTTSDTTRTYIILSSVGAGTPTSITIAPPGLVVAGANGDTWTITGGNASTYNYIANLAFSRDAVHLIARQPMLPVQIGGTATGLTGSVGTLIANSLLPDPRSKLVYQLCAWGEHRQITIELGLAYGVGVPNPQNLFVVLG